VGHAVGLETYSPMSQIADWVFIELFCIARGQRYLSGASRSFLGKRSVSFANYYLLGPPAVRPLIPLSMITLTAIRNRDTKVYSVTASC
jgi:hypothetical protein